MLYLARRKIPALFGGAAAPIPWYRAGGIDASNVVAAYQPLGAASLAASYVNLANPGTYDATPGTAPTFSTALGWVFASASSQFLKTGWSEIGTDRTILVRFSGAGGTDDKYLVGGGTSSPTGTAFIIAPSGYYAGRYYASSSLTVTTAPRVAAGVIGISNSAGVGTAYYNGAADGTLTGTPNPVSRETLIGALFATYGFIDASVQAVAIYNRALNATEMAAVSAAMAALTDPNPFTPLTLADLVAWYDFSDATTLFTDSARTTPVAADADPIGGVADKSGNAKHLSSSGAARPAYKTNIKNSRAVSRYDGTNHYFTLPSLALTNKRIYAVVKNTGSGAADQVLLGHSGGSYALDFSTSGRLIENGGPVSANSSWSPNNWYIVELASEFAVDGRFFVNGNDVSSTTPYTAQSITQLSGRLNTNNIVWQGDIAEVLIYSRKLAADEILLARNYLNNKWAVY